MTAAIELADAEGLGALSMRRVAERLGKSAMTLYTYVPGKAELLDLMLDMAFGEPPTSHPLEEGWARGRRSVGPRRLGLLPAPPVGPADLGGPSAAPTSSTSTRRSCTWLTGSASTASR